MYDYVAPCFPPSYAVFERLFGIYHVSMATVIDTLGKHAKQLSIKGALRAMEFVRKYMVRAHGTGHGVGPMGREGCLGLR